MGKNIKHGAEQKEHSPCKSEQMDVLAESIRSTGVDGDSSQFPVPGQS